MFSLSCSEIKPYFQRGQRQSHATDCLYRIALRAKLSRNLSSFGATSPALQAQRVSKVLSARGICSRREAEELISQGSVLADNLVAQLGTKIVQNTEIQISGVYGLKSLRIKSSIFLNKPSGVVSNLPAKNEKEANDLVELQNAKTHEHAGSKHLADNIVARGIESFHACGRLDKDSRGLLLLSQDGVLARATTGGNAIPKTYLVEVDQNIMDSQILALNGPVSFDGEIILPMRVRKLAPMLLEFVLREGRNRQIRRVCEKVGLQVVDLLRVRVSSCELGNLHEGSWQVLSGSDNSYFKQLGRPLPDKTGSIQHDTV